MKLKRIGILILSVGCLCATFSSCGKKKDDWQADGELAEYVEVEQPEVEDDYGTSMAIDDILDLKEIKREIHYADLRLYRDVYNETLLPHESQLLARAINDYEDHEQHGVYEFNNSGGLTIEAKNEKIVKAEYRTSSNHTPTEWVTYAMNTIYTIIPNVQKQSLNNFYETVSAWIDSDAANDTPMFISGGYTVTIKSGNSVKSGFTMEIIATN